MTEKLKPQKKVNPRVTKKKCPACGWQRAFERRGELHGQYNFKCCKCGEKW